MPGTTEGYQIDRLLLKNAADSTSVQFNTSEKGQGIKTVNGKVPLFSTRGRSDQCDEGFSEESR